MKNPNILNKVLFVAVVVFVFAIGYRAGNTGVLGGYSIPLIGTSSSMPSPSEKQAASQNSKGIDFDLMWEAWDKFEEKFVDRKNLTKQNMFYNAIKGVLATGGDPYTFFLTPEENRDSKDSLGGKFQGIGAQLGTRDGQIVVIAPIANSPALAAGIKSGDIVMAVDGKSIKGQNITQVVSKIRGPADTVVKVTMLRGKKEIVFEIRRAQIQIDVFEVKKEGSTAIVKLNQFGETTISEWQKIVDDLSRDYKAGVVRNLVLDLRDNPGGFLDAAVYVASEFLDYGDLIVSQEGLRSTQDYKVTREGQLRKIPTIVLISGGSASASEILSGALKSHKRAILVGTKSFGKGSVQEIVDLRGGSGIHVTVAKWKLPNGEWIHGRGIEPDHKVENPDLDIQNTAEARKNDKQLDFAIDMVKKQN